MASKKFSHKKKEKFIFNTMLAITYTTICRHIMIYLDKIILLSHLLIPASMRITTLSEHSVSRIESVVYKSRKTSVTTGSKTEGKRPATVKYTAKIIVPYYIQAAMITVINVINFHIRILPGPR